VVKELVVDHSISLVILAATLAHDTMTAGASLVDQRLSYAHQGKVIYFSAVTLEILRVVREFVIVFVPAVSEEVELMIYVHQSHVLVASPTMTELLKINYAPFSLSPATSILTRCLVLGVFVLED